MPHIIDMTFNLFLNYLLFFSLERTGLSTSSIYGNSHFPLTNMG
jgi:hypothetical protein